MINLDQKITFPKLLVDVGHLGNPQGFVKLVILSLEPRKLEGNEPKINIFQVFDQNREVIAEMQELQGALNLLQVALGYQVHIGKQDVKKNLLIFGHCQNRLDPPPSLANVKTKAKKSASNNLDSGWTPPHPP